MKKLKNAALILISFLTATALLVPVVSYVLVRFSLETKITENHNSLLKHLPRIKEDLQLIDKNPPYPNLSFHKSADLVFGPHVSWAGEGVEKINAEENARLKSLFEKNKNWIRTGSTPLHPMITGILPLMRPSGINSLPLAKKTECPRSGSLPVFRFRNIPKSDSGESLIY